MKDILINESANEKNPKWENIIKREKELYTRENDIRSEFERDYTRVIHSTGYRRMKHKTQVFFSPTNDHICTRGEHVMHVESVSYTIAKYLGLNVELTKAIAIAHDIGHSPFGHEGEKVLSKILERDCQKKFWHERNGLERVDSLELLEDNKGYKQNLNLTYAVRDGIISHCGEIDENNLRPRDEYIDLKQYNTPNQYAPYTWEGCVVKIADKISYLGRDIEDAITLGILDESLDDLYRILKLEKNSIINNTVIINRLIIDLCENSSLEKGLSFSEEAFNIINEIKRYNYQKIYYAERKEPSKRYIELVLNEIYDTLHNSFANKKLIKRLYPELINDFEEWLSNYWNIERNEKLKNDVIFNIENEIGYCQAIIYYLSGMTDNYAIDMYNKIIGF